MSDSRPIIFIPEDADVSAETLRLVEQIKKDVRVVIIVGDIHAQPMKDLSETSMLVHRKILDTLTHPVLQEIEFPRKLDKHPHEPYFRRFEKHRRGERRRR